MSRSNSRSTNSRLLEEDEEEDERPSDLRWVGSELYREGKIRARGGRWGLRGGADIRPEEGEGLRELGVEGNGEGV